MAAIVPSLRRVLSGYLARPQLDLSFRNADPEHALTRYLLFYLMPLWTAAGLLDWYWHKNTDIEHTAGTKESLIHLLMFTEAGAPLVLGLFCEVNAGLLSAMAAALATHEATSFWDVAYATDHRTVKTGEQHTHSFMEVLPFMALSMTSCLHWDQVQSIVGASPQRPQWGLRLKERRLPTGYLFALAGLIAGGILLPYGNELWRCWRARNEPHHNSACLPTA